MDLLSFSRRFLCLLAVVLAVLSSSSRTVALEKEGLSVSSDNPVDEADYSAIPTSAGGIFTDPATCRTDVTCDTIPIELDASGYPPHDKIFLQLTFTLSWNAEDAEGTAVPDLDMYIYDETEENEVGSGASSVQPERAGVEYSKRNKTTLYAVIVNFAGGPSAYHLKAEADGILIKEIPKFTRPTAGDSPRLTPSPKIDPVLPPPPSVTGPRETLKPVVTPGPDGAPTAVDLQALDISAARSEGGAAWWVILLSALGAAGVVGGTGFLLFRRVRLRSS